MTFHSELVKFIEALNTKKVNELKDLIDSLNIFSGSETDYRFVVTNNNKRTIY